ncbi:DUF2922 domain-containing protein [Acidaminococcus sp. NSJ-142]|jgi:hypothetical protein|uniref:DUF2922 family protein n=1 Tax=Acidaminococcus hominis TaxID=2897706 RepID=UPI001E47FA56|nr:DUF2922 family protein [Acidaminococcus hominis]MCD2434780.1 DUF2922 domain-containing protein [Acidaminococcus hominis]
MYNKNHNLDIMFKDNYKNSRTVRIPCPKETLTAEAVTVAAQEIINLGTLLTDKNYPLVSMTSAKVKLVTDILDK